MKIWTKPKSRTLMNYSCFWIGMVFTILGESALGASFTTLVNNGKSSNRVDVVFLGDGYTAIDLASGFYDNHISNYLTYWFSDSLNTAPFFRYRNYFNIHKIDVLSRESGADIPPEGIFRETALDASYYFDGVTERLLSINPTKADSVRDLALASADFTAEMQYVTVNDRRYGGAGGRYATYAGGNPAALEVALHEIGHSFSNLADEYGGNVAQYQGLEPIEPNVTTDSAGAKWADWQGYNQPGIGPIAVYEGGRYYDRGIYRPSLNSKMRSLDNPFDAISREAIILDIYDFVDPLDSWLDNSLLLTNPDKFFVDVIDETVIDLQWSVNGSRVDSAVGEQFHFTEFGYGAGDYVVSVRAFDPTAFDPTQGWVRRDRTKLEQTVYWTLKLTAPLAVPEPEALTSIVGLGFFLLAQSRRR